MQNRVQQWCTEDAKKRFSLTMHVAFWHLHNNQHQHYYNTRILRFLINWTNIWFSSSNANNNCFSKYGVPYIRRVQQIEKVGLKNRIKNQAQKTTHQLEWNRQTANRCQLRKTNTHTQNLLLKNHNRIKTICQSKHFCSGQIKQDYCSVRLSDNNSRKITETESFKLVPEWVDEWRSEDTGMQGIPDLSGGNKNPAG